MDNQNKIDPLLGYNDKLKKLAEEFIKKGWAFSHDFGKNPVLKKDKERKIVRESGYHFNYKL